MEAVRLASKYGPVGLAGLMSEARWRDGLDREVVEAARRGDERTVRMLLGIGPRIGELTPDGSKYIGISPNSGTKLFAAAVDAPELMNFGEADRYAKSLAVHEHKDWRLPTREELKILFNTRAEIGGFTTRDDGGVGHWYWSCTEIDGWTSSVWARDFTNGLGDWVRKDFHCLSSRVVRAEP